MQTKNIESGPCKNSCTDIYRTSRVPPVQSIEVGCHAVIQYWMIPFLPYTGAETANAFRWAGQPSKLPLHRPNKAGLKSLIINLYVHQIW